MERFVRIPTPEEIHAEQAAKANRRTEAYLREQTRGRELPWNPRTPGAAMRAKYDARGIPIRSSTGEGAWRFAREFPPQQALQASDGALQPQREVQPQREPQPQREVQPQRGAQLSWQLQLPRGPQDRGGRLQGPRGPGSAQAAVADDGSSLGRGPVPLAGISPGREPPRRPNEYECEQLNLFRKTGRPIEIHLRGGGRLAGRLLRFDQYSLIVELDGVPAVVFKHAVDLVRPAAQPPT